MEHQLLLPATLKSTTGFHTLLDHFETVIDSPDIRIDGLVEQLLEYPGLLPRLLSG